MSVAATAPSKPAPEYAGDKPGKEFPKLLGMVAEDLDGALK